MATTAPEAGVTVGAGASGSSGFRARRTVLLHRALERGVDMYDLTATGLGRFCGMDRRTMVGVLNGRPVSMPTMLTLMDYFGNPGEPIEALFEPIPAGDGYRRPGK